MARSSKRRNRRVASAFLLLLVLGLGAVAVAKIRQDEIAVGAQWAVWAFLPLALLLGFTLPVRCRVRTTRGTACGNDAYGLLFGCSRAAGHWSGKLRARLGAGKDISEQAPVGKRNAVMYQNAPGDLISTTPPQTALAPSYGSHVSGEGFSIRCQRCRSARSMGNCSRSLSRPAVSFDRMMSSSDATCTGTPSTVTRVAWVCHWE